MNRSRYFILAALAAAAPALAQQPVVTQAGSARDSAAATDTQPTKQSASRLPRYIASASQIQHIRYADQRGVNVFDAARKLAQARGWAFNWRLVELPGVGHSASKMFAAPQAWDALAP